MTPEIERLAKEAGLERSRCAKDPRWLGSNEQLAKLVHLTAEECAKEAEKQEDNGIGEFASGATAAANNAAAAIRAKFALSHKTPEAK
ncbi:hypothetical protein [Polaromonas sp. YR568]|uniref:hypothetical protein n=1 Tax=Polaromonas sp. YR568 TaxID=1855301 RepID=UPI0031379FD1